MTFIRTFVEKRLVNSPHRKFQQCFRRFRANLDFGEFRPLPALIYPQHRFVRDLTQSEAPAYRLILTQQFHFALQKAAIVEGTYVIGCSFVVERDYAESL